MSRILVLGAYGLIGSYVARHLLALGHDVIGLGRDSEAAQRVLPDSEWVIRDLRSLTQRDDWIAILDGVDVVVNCAGAVQSSPRDNLDAIHLYAISALVLACEKTGVALVQISAAGADPQAALPYYRTKGEGDAVIRESSATWWIFRPGFVLSPSAYGNVMLIRVLASFPKIIPLIFPDARLQTISVFDVADAVGRAIAGDIRPGTIADLVEDDSHSMREIVVKTRRWLGFRRPLRVLVMPLWLVTGASRLVDAMEVLGWRSPLRTSAVATIKQSVSGNALQTRAVLGRPALSFAENQVAWHARTEDRLFARIQLIGPFITFALALQWIASGTIGLFHIDDGVLRLTTHGHGVAMSKGLGVGMALVTMFLGVSIFVRSWTSRALHLMVLVSIFYLAGMTILMPSLWLDPLGPLLRLFPTIFLALIARQLMETR